MGLSLCHGVCKGIKMTGVALFASVSIYQLKGSLYLLFYEPYTL